MTAKQKLGFKIWTTLLSLFVALMLYPNIVRKHGVGKSALITALAVGAIWLMYFFISRIIEWAVSEELKKRDLKRPKGKQNDHPVGENHEDPI
jgi:ATP/ADP translocase